MQRLYQIGLRYNKDGPGKVFRDVQERAAVLRRRAEMADEAAHAVQHADKVEAAMQEFKASMHADIDVQVGLALTRRKIKVGDFVATYASSHQGMGKKGHQDMLSSLNIASAPEEMDALFDRFDDDRSGYLDAAEALEVLKQLQRRGIEANKTRDNKARQATRARLKATKLTDAVYSLPPISGPSLDSVPEDSLLAEEGTPGSIRGVPLALRADAQADSGSQEDRRALPRLSAREMRRREKEREKRVKQITAQAVKRLPLKQVGKGMNAWRAWHQDRVYILEKVRQGSIRFRSRDVVRGLVQWQEYVAQRLWFAAQLGPALVKLSHRELTRGLLAWLLRWEDQLETNRLMAKAARSASQLRAPQLVGAFDAWRANGQLRSALKPERMRRGRGANEAYVGVQDALTTQALLCAALCTSLRKSLVATAALVASSLSESPLALLPIEPAQGQEGRASSAKAAAVAEAVARRRRLGRPPTPPASQASPAPPERTTPQTSEGRSNQSHLQSPGESPGPTETVQGEPWRLGQLELDSRGIGGEGDRGGEKAHMLEA